MADAGESARVGFIGKQIGRYLVRAELGQGGMATVYRARDLELDRDVALKIMHGYFMGRADLEARFRREARAVAAIRHPSILAVYDFAPPRGEEPAFITSELIEGPTLRQHLDDCGGRLLPETALLICVRVAEALAAAHSAGIVHRDVKPDNVLLEHSDKGARVLLTDFGVAHMAGQETMTATGAVLGSPAYMSPEQARSQDVGPASDVFSLGVLLYQLSTGRLPFVGQDPLTVLASLLRGDFLRPSQVNAHVGPDLERVVLTMLHRDPAARFPDGAAAAVALRGALAASQLGSEEAVLASYLRNPAEFEREISPKIAARAAESAAAAHRRRNLPRALAEVGRALAYDPENAAAQAVFARIGAGRRWRRVAVAAAVVATATVTVAGSMRYLRGRDIPGEKLPERIAVAGASVTSAAPTALPTTPHVAAPAGPGTAVSGIAANQPGPQVQLPASRREAARAGHVVSDRHPRARSTTTRTTTTRALETRAAATREAATHTPSSASDGTAPGSGDGSPVKMDERRLEADSNGGEVGATSTRSTTPTHTTKTPTVSPPVAASPASSASAGASAQGAAGAATTASLILRASQGFCEPSVDDRSPSLRANYDGLPPGPHEIFCTLPQGGPRVRVGTYNLRAGSRPTLIIVRGPDGRPTLSRPD